jgi:hypothetical protein
MESGEIIGSGVSLVSINTSQSLSPFTFMASGCLALADDESAINTTYES